MQNKNAISLRYKIIPLALTMAALLCSCTNTLPEKSQETTRGGYEQSKNSSSDSLTVTARVSNGSARYALPSSSISDFDYAALLYPNVNSSESTQTEVFVKGEMTDENKIQFSFQRPNETDGISFTLEVFAFVKLENAADNETNSTEFSRENALLSGKTTEPLTIDNDSDEIQVRDPIELSSNKPGTVNLKIKVPSDCTLDIDDTAKMHFKCEKENETSNTYSITANGISAGAYPVTFTVKKKVGENDEIIHVFSENINVINGLCTDTWSGLEKGEAKDITNSISKTVYVRGENAPWYTSNAPSATASDENSGSYLSPFATIQKAVDTVIARNNGTSDDKTFTIYIDGKLTQSTVMENMARIAPDKDLNLTIESMSANTNAILDAANNGRVMSISSDRGGIPSVMLKNIHITGGNATENGGGVYVSGGSLRMESGTISGCIATNKGGGIYACNSASLTLKNCAIKSCETTSTDSNTGGGGICNDGATIEIEGGEISGCKAGMNGGGIFAYNGTFTMSGSIKIIGNEAENGGGVYTRVGTFTMNGGTVGGESTGDANTATNGSGIYVGSYGVIKDSTFRMKGGTIRGNNTHGVFINGGNFYMSDSAKVESNNRVYSPSSNPIRIAGALNATPPVATFDLNSYNMDRTVLSADDGVTIDEDICNKIALTDEGCKIVPSADGKKGVLKVHTIFLNSENGKDYYSGVGTSIPAKTLSKAIEKYDTYNAEKIMVCAPYTLPSSESTLLDRTDKTHLTLMRYAGSSDGSGALTGNLLSISQGSVDIVNTTLDGNKNNVSAEGSLLYIDGATVTLGTDATLGNNKTTSSDCSGGITINSGTFEMTSGAITGNIANSSEGGGVYVNGGSTFNMSGGEISGNKAAMGGGVTIRYNGTFAMSGGTISRNEASFGSGVYDIGTFRMTDAAKVESDNDVYLYSGRTIRASGLTASAPVATITPSTYTSNTKVLLTIAGGPPSTTLCNKFAVTPDPDGNQWKVSLDANSAAGVLKMAN